MTFGEKRFQQTLHSHKEILDKFYAGFDDASKLKGTAQIFLDTNVLLRIYSTSFKAREKLLQFFIDYGPRITLSAQVQWEYVKNRENVITKFSKDVTQTIPDNFQATILGGVAKFTTDHKTILTDYPNIQSELAKLQTEAERLLELINKEVKTDKVSSETILYKDEFIALFQKLELLNPLENRVLEKIKKEFDELIKEIDKSDTDKETFKCFPGCYEKKEKSEDPYGDYIIYHEMMEYAKKHGRDVIFLTYDITKGDWMQKNKNPHLHFVENFYQNTGRVLYILDGQRTFDDLLDINFKSLIRNSKTSEITVETLKSFLKTFGPFDGVPMNKIDQRHVEELLFNGISSLNDLENRLSVAKNAIPTIMSQLPETKHLGLMRFCLAATDFEYLAFLDNGVRRRVTEVHEFLKDIALTT